MLEWPWHLWGNTMYYYYYYKTNHIMSVTEFYAQTLYISIKQGLFANKTWDSGPYQVGNILHILNRCHKNPSSQMFYSPWFTVLFTTCTINNVHSCLHWISFFLFYRRWCHQADIKKIVCFPTSTSKDWYRIITFLDWVAM